MLIKDPYHVDVDKVSNESYKEALKTLSITINEFDVLKLAIYTVSIRMFHVVQ